ncbi:MAG: hypothetical protein KAR06_12410, partial [Deltaproteobacteria bacterium]|nr:hypothetical protein [Deltaproteobacteria bacterium]
MHIKCPKCGAIQKQTNKCEKCGIIINKYLQELEAEEERKITDAKKARTEVPKQSRKGFFFIVLVLLLIIGVVGYKKLKTTNIFNPASLISERYGFSIDIPEDWHTFEVSEAVPDDAPPLSLQDYI